MEKIYFDHGSTSFPKAPGVAEAVSHLLAHGAFNINRGNYEGAYEVADQVLQTRELLAELFHARDSRQVVFNSGITCSMNQFLKGFLRPGDHVITTGMEHNAVMRPLCQMETMGITYDMAPVDDCGNLDPRDVEKLIRPETRAVVMLHASNVCGTVMPVEAVGKVCRQHGIYFAVDTAQSAGTIDVDMEKCCIDFLGFTGHKGLLGPQGIGGFLISDRLDQEMIPLLAGGTGSQSDSLSQPEFLPDKYESGTMNLPGIVGLHAALTYLKETGIENCRQRKMELTGYFLRGLEALDGVKVIGEPGIKNRTAVVSVDLPGKDNAVAAFTLEQEYGIMTRVGLHCAPMAHRSLGTYPEGTIRFAFGEWNTKAEIDGCIRALDVISR